MRLKRSKEGERKRGWEGERMRGGEGERERKRKEIECGREEAIKMEGKETVVNIGKSKGRKGDRREGNEFERRGKCRQLRERGESEGNEGRK